MNTTAAAASLPLMRGTDTLCLIHQIRCRGCGCWVGAAADPSEVTKTGKTVSVWCKPKMGCSLPRRQGQELPKYDLNHRHNRTSQQRFIDSELSPQATTTSSCSTVTVPASARWPVRATPLPPFDPPVRDPRPSKHRTRTLS